MNFSQKTDNSSRVKSINAKVFLQYLMHGAPKEDKQSSLIANINFLASLNGIRKSIQVLSSFKVGGTSDAPSAKSKRHFTSSDVARMFVIGEFELTMVIDTTQKYYYS